MDIDVESSPQPQTQTEAQQPHTHHGVVSDTGLPVQSIQESVDSRGNRIVIIEELDTPATRRERTKRAKAERARLAAEVGDHMTIVPDATDSGEHDRSSDKPMVHLGQEESDLSSLSGDSDERSGDDEVQAPTSTKRGRGRGRVQTQGKTSRPKSPGLGNISLPPGERLESGTLGISWSDPCFWAVSDVGMQFGRNTSRILGGAQLCMMTTCRISQRASCNELIIKKIIWCDSMIILIYGTCICDLGWDTLSSLLTPLGHGYLRTC